MTMESIFTIIVDIVAIILLLIGFINEDLLIKFEDNLRRIVFGNYRRLKKTLITELKKGNMK